MSIHTRFRFLPGSRQEVIAALYPFILAGAILPLGSMAGRSGILPVPNPLVAAVMTGLVGVLGLLLIIGLVLGLPRWSLPYLGFLLAILSVYLFFGLLERPVGRLYSDLFDRSSLFGDIFLDGVLWSGLLLAMVVLVLGSTVSPGFRRFRNDWTLLSFIFYGAIPFVIRISFDEYVGEEPYELLMFLILACGAWLYLRSDDPQKRFWALFGALAASIVIIAAGKAILIPFQEWPVDINSGLVRSEVKHTLIMWGWLALIMLFPLLLKGLSETDDASQVDD